MGTNNKRATSILSAAVVTLGMLAWQSATAAEFTLKIGLVTFKDQQHAWADMYKEAIEKASNGRIEAKVFPQGQLGEIPRQIEGLQLGTVEAFISPTDFYVGVDPRYGVYSIPTLFKDPQHAAKVVLDPALNQEALNLGDPKGLVGVTIFSHSAAHYLAKKPIMRLEDFKGLKLRVNATAAEREKMKRFGATAVPMPLGEVLPSIQRGVIDGTMSGMAIYVAFKFNQISPVVTVTNDTLLISQAHLSKVWLNKLPADLRETVVKTALDLQPKIREFSQQKGESYNEEWRKMGGKIHVLPPEELAKVNSLLASVGDDVTKDDPALNAYYKKVKAVAAKY